MYYLLITTRGLSYFFVHLFFIFILFFYYYYFCTLLQIDLSRFLFFVSFYFVIHIYTFRNWQNHFFLIGKKSHFRQKSFLIHFSTKLYIHFSHFRQNLLIFFFGKIFFYSFPFFIIIFLFTSLHISFVYFISITKLHFTTTICYSFSILDIIVLQL